MNNAFLKKHLIKVIHTLKSENGISEECYRGILSDMFGVESCKELDEKELYQLAQRFGYAVPFNVLLKSEFCKSGKATKAQIAMIKGLYFKVAEVKNELGLRNFIDRIIGKRPLYLNTLEIKEAQKVIIALKEWQRARKGDKN
ncbi:MAG: regulatory protein GemA [Helicobacter sp.]|uniref:phage protein GemA/Gp16 family protein n=1 Tax=Helicobacter sp. TaxID=218 RepID=UPI0023D611F1|nr:phage protein GemA/Gp16 family protein [Helicobacter sp.]MDE5925603.1 regulatory protein GemA [Helicobacter sp.]MDE7174454.1 regulatory protein GemA [Helicobacter sp.]